MRWAWATLQQKARRNISEDFTLWALCEEASGREEKLRSCKVGY